jgi:peptidoglycan/LPS O-acetylase OafA/YrhL
MLRSILAIVAGCVVLIASALLTDTVLLKLFPAMTDARGRVTSAAVAFLMLSYSLAYCVVAGWVARRREVAHALALGVVLVLLLIFPTIQFWDTTPAWYHFALFALTVPACVAGGRWRALRKSQHDLGAATATA